MKEKFDTEYMLDGYTLLVSRNNEQLSGCYLKYTSRGMLVEEVSDERLAIFNSFPNIVESLEDGSIVQMYQDDTEFVTQIGLPKTEGPYCEVGYLSVNAIASSSSIIQAFGKLEEMIEKSKGEFSSGKAYEKAYRYYGAARYQ